MFRALVGEAISRSRSCWPRRWARHGAESRYRWVFDPLDGTTNYAHGIPIFCATLALEIDGVPTVGAVFDPNRRELFTAERGVGAWLNGRRAACLDHGDAARFVLVTGFPYDIRTKLDDLLGLFRSFLLQARAVRRLGSAAIDLCWVAAGRMDGFWEQGLKAWDTMAARPRGPGSRRTRDRGSTGRPGTPHGGNVLASNGHIHDEMVAVIRDHTPASQSSEFAAAPIPLDKRDSPVDLSNSP